METLTHPVLIYDKNCPFCTWYTGAFVRAGFLDKDGRIPYNEAADNAALHFDRNLSRNKIALADPQTGTVHYGIDSLLIVLGKKLPLIRKIGQFPPVHFLLSQLYSFISYNRKAIAPSDCNDACGCAPDRSIPWRAAFIVACALIVNLATGLYFTQQLHPWFTGIANGDLIFFAVQLPFQWIFFRALGQRDFYSYAGNLAFVSCLGALLLLGFHFGLNALQAFGIDITLLQPLSFGVVLTFMFYEHTRRLKLLHLSPVLTLTWILFRICIYPFAFNLFAL